MKRDINHKIIWSAFRAGEEEAFTRLYFTFYDALFRYGLKLVGNEEFVKGVIQEFFVYLFEKRESLADQIDNPTSYLLTSLRRRLLDKKSYPKIKHVSFDPNDQIISELFVIGPEDIMIKEESDSIKKNIVLNILNGLPARQKEIIYLKYYHDMSIQEIANMLSISYQVVANHLYRSLKKLRSQEISKTYVISKA